MTKNNSVANWLKHLERKWLPRISNTGDNIIKRAKRQGKRSFLIFWNRGMGDVPLHIVAFIARIRGNIADAKIHVLTRSDLAEIFAMVENVNVLILETLKRRDQTTVFDALKALQRQPNEFDVIFERLNLDRWLAWTHGKFTPRLKWQHEWDSLCERFRLDRNDYIGMHVDTETGHIYGYNKNWPAQHWQQLIEILTEKQNKHILLFGLAPKQPLQQKNVIDLRGKTNFLELSAIIKNHCRQCVLPDSGILSSLYYIDTPFAIDIVSLWGERQNVGIRQLNVASPNPELRHHSLLGMPQIESISVQNVLEALNSYTSCSNPSKSICS